MARRLRAFRNVAIVAFTAAFFASASRGVEAGGWNVECWGSDVYVWGGVGSGISCDNAWDVCDFGCEECNGFGSHCQSVNECYLDEMVGSCTF